MFVTSQGSAQGRFHRACERGSAFDAEPAARELGFVSLPTPLLNPAEKRLHVAEELAQVNAAGGLTSAVGPARLSPLRPLVRRTRES